MFFPETHRMTRFRTSGGRNSFKLKFIVIGCLFGCYCAFGDFSAFEKVEGGRRSPAGWFPFLCCRTKATSTDGIFRLFVFIWLLSLGNCIEMSELSLFLQSSTCLLLCIVLHVLCCVVRLLTGRSLLLHEDGEAVNCTNPAIDEFPPDLFSLEQRRHGAILLHFFLTCYLFILLAYVCDDYFVPSIKTLCDRLRMSEDVAGATFMAAATSSPELFINIVGTFVTKGDIGVGTIVGSAVFNILAVPACCGLFGGQSVEIDWWPLTRDCFAYGVTVVLLIVSLHDGHIDWYEALILVVLYVFYIIAMYYNDAVSNKVKKFMRRRRRYKEANLRQETSPLLKNNSTLGRLDFKLQVEDAGGSEGGGSTQSAELTDGEALQAIPLGFWSKCFFFLSWPILFILFLTIPDCRREKQKKLWPITFLMCIAWIASTSYLVSWMITVMGNTLSIPDSVMGLTFLAAGMSVPEATSSVIVTNQGHGAMGISSSIGSNTFDILLCLGLPWLIKSTFLPAEPGNHIVKINSQGLGYSAMSLLTTLTLLYASFAFNHFTLDRKIGFICLLMYLSFLIFASLIELNVFFTVNLPLCGS